MIIEQEIQSFIEDYKKLPGTIGVFWGGSSSGGQLEHFSDIDIFVVTDDTIARHSGLRQCKHGMIDFFVNPLSRITRQMTEEIESIHDYWTIKIYAFSLIIYDSDGRAQDLQNHARTLFNVPFFPPDETTDLANHYTVFDIYNNFCKQYELGLQWRVAYYSCLKAILHAVCYHHGTPLIPWLKAERLLVDKGYRERYHLKSLPPNDFVELFLQCLNEQSNEAMKNNLKTVFDWCIIHSPFSPSTYFILKQ